VRGTVVLAILAAAAATPLAAQRDRLRIGGEAVAHFVRESTPTEEREQSGTWVGAQVEVGVGRVSAKLLGLVGPLGGNPLRADRDVRLTALQARYAVLPWLGVGIDAEAMRLHSDLATSLWRTYGVGATISTGLGVEGLSVHVDGGLALGSSVSQAHPIARATRAEAGVAYVFLGAPITVRLDYRVATVDFKDAADLRFGGPVLGVSYTLRR
jgi:hypothetical protein